jgi:hypothetical protein
VLVVCLEDADAVDPAEADEQTTPGTQNCRPRSKAAIGRGRLVGGSAGGGRLRGNPGEVFCRGRCRSRLSLWTLHLESLSPCSSTVYVDDGDRCIVNMNP